MKVGHNFSGGKNVGGPEEVVIVDSKKFLDLWKNEPFHSERKLAFGDEYVWRSDYKFHYAEDGFAQGIDNPVPLAYVHCYFSDFQNNDNNRLINLLSRKTNKIKRPYCTFTNGITRTIWLLANGAECFPVITDKHSHKLLRLYAGADDVESMVQKLMAAITNKNNNKHLNLS